jgi:predicted DNA-binding protein
MITVTLPHYAEQFLYDLAENRGKTPERVASESLEEWLENQALLRLAVERKAEWVADGKKTYSLDEIEAMYGLQDEV